MLSKSSPSIYRSPEGQAELMAVYDRAVARLGVEYKDRMVNTRFGVTHVLVVGPEDAPPLVNLHGGNSIAPHDLVAVLPLGQEYRIYAPDTIGHPGKSAQTRLSPRDNSYGQWVVQVLDGLGLDQVPFVAGSFGAGILLRTAACAPERIAKAVLVVPSGIVPVPIFSMVFHLGLPYLLYRWFPSQDRLIRLVQPLCGDELDETLLDYTRVVVKHVVNELEMPRPATKSELAKFTAPTLVLAGEKDIMFPGDAVLERAREIIPNLVAAERLDGCPHHPAKYREYITERIRRFLKERTAQ